VREGLRPDGKLLRTIGKPGGRALSGKYDPKGMFRPLGIAVDAQQRLWVAECDLSPRRISVWDAHSGQFLREFCGSTYYASSGARVNPLNPRQAFVLGNVCELDWKKGLWRVTGTLYRRTTRGSLFDLGADWVTADVRRRGDRTMLLVASTFCCSISELHEFDARPLAAIGSVRQFYREGEKWPELILKHLAAPRRLHELQEKFPRTFNGLARGYDGNGQDVSSMLDQPGVSPYFLWIDRNGDGQVQEDEISFYSKGELNGLSRIQGNWTFPVGPDLTLYLVDANDKADHSSGSGNCPLRMEQRRCASL